MFIIGPRFGNRSPPRAGPRRAPAFAPDLRTGTGHEDATPDALSVRAGRDVQARFYEAALRTFWNEPWFCGYSWWDWPARPYAKEQAAGDKQFYIYGKPAEEVLRRWYAKPRGDPAGKGSTP